jgi:hypothetical protein
MWIALYKHGKGLYACARVDSGGRPTRRPVSKATNAMPCHATAHQSTQKTRVGGYVTLGAPLGQLGARSCFPR